MGYIAELNAFDDREANVDPGGGANRTVDHYAPAGDDSQPITGDYASVVSVQGSGSGVVVGYRDANNESKASAGDKRIYARDSDGAEICQIWLKNDGAVLVSNGNGSLELKTTGEIEANGAKITTGGDFVTALGVSLNNHTHIGNLGVATSVPTPTEAG